MKKEEEIIKKLLSATPEECKNLINELFKEKFNK
jgi:hypothetical protein